MQHDWEMSRDRIVIRKEENDTDEIWNKHVRNEVYNSDTLAWVAETVTNAGPALPSGAATAANQSTEITRLTSIRDRLDASVAVTGTITDAGAGKTLKTAAFALTATGTVITAVSTKRLKVYSVKLVASAALVVNFRDGASTQLEGAQSLAINGGFVESVNPPAFLFASSAGNSLDLVITGIGTAAGRVSYWDDDVS